MWYCEITFRSGNEKKIIFRNEVEANKFYTECKFSKTSWVENEFDQMLIFLENVETIKKPIEYVNNE